MVKSFEFNPYAKSKKRTLGTNDRHILYDTAGHRCQNPYCKKKIETEADMQIGHKTAYSKGGGTTLRNGVCLCSACNRKQGTDSWERFLKKQADGKVQAKPKTSKPKESKPKRKRRSSSPFESMPVFKEPKLKMPKYKGLGF